MTLNHNKCLNKINVKKLYKDNTVNINHTLGSNYNNDLAPPQVALLITKKIIDLQYCDQNLGALLAKFNSKHNGRFQLKMQLMALTSAKGVWSR